MDCLSTAFLPTRRFLQLLVLAEAEHFRVRTTQQPGHRFVYGYE